jgi:hypothetical protein
MILRFPCYRAAYQLKPIRVIVVDRCRRPIPHGAEKNRPESNALLSEFYEILAAHYNAFNKGWP